MMVDSESLNSLRSFVAAKGGRVKDCVAFYAYPSDPALLQADVVINNRRVSVMASRERLIFIVKAAAPFAFSIGEKHSALAMNTPVECDLNGDPWIAYTIEPFAEHVRRWLGDDACMASVRRLGLQLGESLHVVRNESMLVVLPSRDIEATMRVFLDAVDTFVARAPVDERVRTKKRAKRLPREFRDLDPVAVDWVIPDDEERASRLAATAPRELRTLKALLLPRLQAINEYLDAFAGQPLSSEAQRLQALGELGAELALTQAEQNEGE